MNEPSAELPAAMVAVPRPAGRDLQAYFVSPGPGGPYPGVLVIHEFFGLNAHIRDVAQRFARAGYAALAVDLFSTAGRAVCMARLFNAMLFRPLNNGVMGDLGAALAYLRGQPQVTPERVGAVGFCMGGGFALQLACVNADLRAASVYYGLNPRPLEAVARACPIVGSYPELDFTAAGARKLEPLLEHYRVPHDLKVYPQARHSFFNDQGPSYQAEAAADSWQRTLAFFEAHLRPAGQAA